jgi:hypothetical protein
MDFLFENFYYDLTETDTFWTILGSNPGTDLLLSPWSRFLIEKLTDFQLVKKFRPFYGTRRSITAFTSARHLSLS